MFCSTSASVHISGSGWQPSGRRSSRRHLVCEGWLGLPFSLFVSAPNTVKHVAGEC